MPGRGVAHLLDGRLVRQEVAAVDRVVEVLPGRVALALRVDRAVDAALRADRVGALDGDRGEEGHVGAEFGGAHGGGEPGKASARPPGSIRAP